MSKTTFQSYAKWKQCIDNKRIIRKINKEEENMAMNKDLENIYLERSRYLLNTDELLEQILEDQYNTIPVTKISKLGPEISQENDIRIDTEMPLAFSSNF